MNQRLLTSSIVMALYASSAFAQTADQASPDQDKKKQTLETVTVTGSLIPQSQMLVISGCGHLAPNECAGQIGPGMVGFLKR